MGSVGLWRTKWAQACGEIGVMSGCAEHGERLVYLKCNEKGFKDGAVI